MGAGHPARFHPHGRRGFGGHFVWQAQCLVNLDDVMKGSKVSFCEMLVFLTSDMVMILYGG